MEKRDLHYLKGNGRRKSKRDAIGEVNKSAKRVSWLGFITE